MQMEYFSKLDFWMIAVPIVIVSWLLINIAFKSKNLKTLFHSALLAFAFSPTIWPHEEHGLEIVPSGFIFSLITEDILNIHAPLTLLWSLAVPVIMWGLIYFLLLVLRRDDDATQGNEPT